MAHKLGEMTESILHVVLLGADAFLPLEMERAIRSRQNEVMIDLKTGETVFLTVRIREAEDRPR